MGDMKAKEVVNNMQSAGNQVLIKPDSSIMEKAATANFHAGLLTEIS